MGHRLAYRSPATWGRGGPALAALAIALAALGCDAGDRWLSVVQADSGTERLRVRYEVAATAQARREGLQTRPPLGSDEGLLLEFPIEGEACIHNSAVAYAIDVVFVGADDAVVRDVVTMQAFEAPAACVDDVKRVLELRAGVGAGVVRGDRLVRP